METQTPNEQLAAISQTVISLEDEFVTLGDLLSQVKSRKGHQAAGYEKWSEYVETEHGISSAFANKLIRVYKCFVDSMDKSGEELAEIGLEKLSLLTTLFPKLDEDTIVEQQEEWYEKAMRHNLPDLKAMVKAAKDELKGFDPKDELERQWKETWCELMNCSWKELRFKMALFFMAAYTSPEFITEFKSKIRTLQKQFEADVPEMMRSSATIDFVSEMQAVCDKNGCSVEISTNVSDDVVRFEPAASGEVF